jgi:hypothetical protein
MNEIVGNVTTYLDTTIFETSFSAIFLVNKISNENGMIISCVWTSSLDRV